MKNIGFSFDDLPMAVSQLTDKVNSIYSAGITPNRG